MTAGTLPVPQIGQAYLRRYADRAAALPGAGRRQRARDIDELCEQFTRRVRVRGRPARDIQRAGVRGPERPGGSKRYGVPDVFALAEEMYRRVPRRPPEPEPATDPWQQQARPALHGLLYGLPDRLLPGRGRAARRPQRAQRADRGAARFLGAQPGPRLSRLCAAGPGGPRPGGPAAPGRAWPPAARGAALAMTVRRRTPWGRPSAARLRRWGSITCSAPRCCMVLGAERLLLVVLAPGVLGSAAFLLLGRPPRPSSTPAWAALAATPLLALGAGRGAGQPRAASRRRRPGCTSPPGRCDGGGAARRTAQRRLRPGRRRAAGVPAGRRACPASGSSTRARSSPPCRWR